MTGRQKWVDCEVCPTRTRSATRRCTDHRDDKTPEVAVIGGRIRVGGLDLTPRQAIRLADKLVDRAEEIAA